MRTSGAGLSPWVRRATRAAVLAAALGLVACRGETREAPSSTPASSTARPSEPASPAALPARRLVVMAPSAAEMLAALGLSEQVVGVGDFVGWPPELAARPKVGAYDQPSNEVILALGATDFVTTKSVAGASAFARLHELGVDVVALDTSTYDGTLAAIRTLGERFGKGAEAARLVERIAGAVATVRRRVAGAPRRRVLFVVGRDPIYAAGPGSHIDTLIDAAGGENVAADARSPYPQLALEAVLARRPEVILDSSNNAAGAPVGRLAGWWGAWTFLPAVAERRVYFLDPARLSVPGPRLDRMVELMARLVHPEIFGEATAAELGPLAASTERDGH